MSRFAVAAALIAAALFGLSTPAAKSLVGAVDPWMLAALLYLGSGVGLALVRLARRGERTEAPLTRADVPWLAGAIAAGGVAAPVALMEGLARTDAASSSLLLTLEGVATAVIAWAVFREHYGARVVVGMALIVAGALVLAWRGEPSLEALAGPLLVAGACLGWAIDNNLTRKVAAADPVEIAMWKGLVAGCVTFALALAQGAPLPELGMASAAGIVGFLGYGVSLALFVFALRHLGAARTGAYFSVAPFVGAAAAIPLLGEEFTLALAASGVLIAAGVWLHITERHAHAHVHESISHAHRHEHDAHHRHAHAPGDAPGEPHSHWHVHARLSHAHPHVPDIHHRHGH